MAKWTKRIQAAIWAVFFTYFGGSFGWIVSQFRGKGFDGESMFWAQQSVSTLLNPPFALSLLILFIVLSLMPSLARPKINWWRLLAISLLAGSLAFIKIYASILFIAGLFVAAIYKPYLRNFFVLSVLFSLMFYLPFNRTASSLVVFQPFWFLENMMALSDRFNWPRFYDAMLVYKTTRNIPRFFTAYFVAALIFVIGNLGLRTAGFLQLRGLRKMDAESLILWTMGLAGFLIPLLFLQRGTPWNTIQFFYYTQFVLGIFAAVSLSNWLHRLKFIPGLIVTVITILLVIPTSLDTMKHYLPSRPPAMLSREELAALKTLSALSPGVVLITPISPDIYQPPPRPLYFYESTAYVSAFSDHPVYLEDEVNLNITGYPWKDRLQSSQEFMATEDVDTALKFLSDNSIRYIYLPLVSKYRPFLSANQLNGRVVFENSQSAVWEVLSED